MTSLILRTATRYLFPLLLVFSIYLLLRGHHHPGGGFVGGLSAGAAFALYALAFDVPTARRVVRIPPRVVTAAGLALSLLSGLPALLHGRPLLSGEWYDLPVRTGVKVTLGTPLLFDIGVYFVVMGVLCTLVFALGEEEG